MQRLSYLFPIMFLGVAATLAYVALSPPPGTVLPAMLSTKLDSHVKPGQQIHATIMQSVIVQEGKIPEHSKLVGHVVSFTSGQIVIQFDSLEIKHQVIPVVLGLRAIASPLEVEYAKVPLPDHGASPADWVTRQIGGEIAYRRWHLMHANIAVGETLFDGSTLAPLRASSRGCSDSHTIQALWVFSSDACGAYSYPELTIAPAAVGQIALQFHGKPLVRSGSGLLLQVVSASAAEVK
jgi:hypothetical protein